MLLLCMFIANKGSVIAYQVSQVLFICVTGHLPAGVSLLLLYRSALAVGESAASGALDITLLG